MDEYAINAEHLTKVYRLYNKAVDRLKESFNPFRRQYHTPFYALNDVSLQIKKGETFGIIGKNGSGKSTLLKILTGTLTPTSGRLAVQGRVAALLELGAGFNPEMTGLENIYFSGTIMGFSRKVMEEYVEKIVAFADIGDFIYQPAKMYSSGMFSRLAFAVNTVLDPDIFIVDEALAVGDPTFVHKCMLRFKEMQAKGTTILLVTHDVGLIKMLCQRALWLDKGRACALGDTTEVCDAYLANLFDLREASAASQASATPVASPDLPATDTMTIPPYDKRIGNEDMAFTGATLCDAQGKAVSAVETGSTLQLRLSFCNVRYTGHFDVAVGYILRNYKGLEIASSNSMEEGLRIPSLAIQERCTLTLRIELPLLHPGKYSFSLVLALMRGNNGHILFDKLENVLFIDLWSTKTMYTFINLRTTYSIE